MLEKPFISVCILSYNRPETLLRLLRTLDTKYRSEIEIVICEDCSPRQREIRETIEKFKSENQYTVVYQENSQNLGYDGTFCELVKFASGHWLLFMGDDDEFVAGGFDKYVAFLHQHPELGYVMKAHYLVYSETKKEAFKYFKDDQFFPPGVEAYTKMFRRSVFIAGFLIRREYALPYLTNRFDGTMLIQLYLLAEVVLRYPSAYYNEPLTQQYASHAHNEKDVMYDREKKQFIARKPTLDISLNFLASFAKITEYVDQKHGLNSTQMIKKDMSKYFYPSLAVHRNSGVRFFLNYVRELNKLGFNASIYFNIYVLMLLIFGKRFCDWGIFTIKKILGRTPQL